MNINLREARKKAGLTQVEVAKKAKISARYYQSIEAGENKPNVDIAIRIAKALKTTVEELF